MYRLVSPLINRLYTAQAPAATNAKKSPIGLSLKIKLPLNITNATPINEMSEPITMFFVARISFEKAISIENSNEDVKPFHDILMAENIIFIEVLKNLEYLEKDVFFISFSPLPIVGLDSSPVHAYAIEGLAEFS